MEFGKDKRVSYLKGMDYDTLKLILNENKECLKNINMSSLWKFYTSIGLKVVLFCFVIFPLIFGQTKQGIKELWVILLCNLLIFIYSIKEFTLHEGGIDSSQLIQMDEGHFKDKNSAVTLLILFYDDICKYNAFKAKRKDIASMASCALSIFGIMVYTIYIVIDKQ
jgi:hypothetical protein